MKNNNQSIVSPYGGVLINLLAGSEERDELIAYSHSLPKIQMSFRSICDFELLSTGAFSPVTRFLGKSDYRNVLENMRLMDGTVFPIPLTLPVNKFDGLKLDKEFTLVDQYNRSLAVIRAEEIYEWNAEKEAELVYGTTNSNHPLVNEMQGWGKYNISGEITALELPQHYNFKNIRLTPADVRTKLEAFDNSNVVAFQTRNPLHRSHEEMTKRAAEIINGTLLLHPVVGMTQPGDIEYFTRVHSYIKLVEKYYGDYTVLLALLPLAMRMAGPREALWHAIIRRNFGANYFIVGRYHATPGALNSSGKPFYSEYAAHDLLIEYQEEIGIKPILFSDFVYLPEDNTYEELNKLPKNKSYIQLSGTNIRNLLKKGENIPEWELRPEVAETLRESLLSVNRQGVCIWFTGLSGSGKSTTANVLITKLMELGRQVTLLDGDIVRANLSKGLGFSKEDRDINIRRIGFVASEIVKHDGVVICAAISPYKNVRDECRRVIGKNSFVEVFVNTPLELCEARDTKGLYAAAREGKLANFTGINDPYEKPADPEITIETAHQSAESNADIIIDYLINNNFIKASNNQ